MKRKTLNLSIGAIVLAGLIGCGGGGNSDTSSTTNLETTQENSSNIKKEQNRLLESGVVLPSLYGEDIPTPTKPVDDNQTIHIPDGLINMHNIYNNIHMTDDDNITIINGNHLTIDNTEFLIITHQDFKEALEPLKEHKEKMGISTKIVTWQELVKKFDGVDNPEKIKRGIASYSNSLRYIMLVGDADKFPTRYCRVYDNVNWGDGWGATDLYYADIFDENNKFATWDNNHNGKFCEMVSAMDQKVSPATKTYINEDRILNSAVYIAVGRLPASNTEEVSNYVNKVIGYENMLRHSGHYYTNLMLVPGNDKNQDSYPYSSNLKESVSSQIIQEASNHNGENSIIKMYHNLDRDKIIDIINQGVGFINYAGHGAPTFWYLDKTPNNQPYFGKNAIDSLQNEDKYPIVFSVACSTGRYNYDKVYKTKDGSTFDIDKNCPYKPKEGIQGCLPAPKADKNAKYAPEPSSLQSNDYLDSMAEEFLVKNPNSGAIAFIGSVAATQTPAQSMDRYFSSIYAQSIYDNSDSPSIERLGDVWFLTLDMFKNKEVNLNEKVSKDWKKAMNFAHLLKYHLFGDPSLLLPHHYSALIR